MLTVIRLPEKSDDLFKQGFKYRHGTWSKMETGGAVPDVADLFVTGAVKGSSRRGGWAVLTHGEYPIGLLKPFLLKQGYVQTCEGFVGMPSEKMRVLLSKQREEETFGFIRKLRLRERKVGVVHRLTLRDQIRSSEYTHLLHSIIPTYGSDGGINWPDPPKLD